MLDVDEKPRPTNNKIQIAESVLYLVDDISFAILDVCDYQLSARTEHFGGDARLLAGNHSTLSTWGSNLHHEARDLETPVLALRILLYIYDPESNTLVLVVV
ncbi:hypothetical protein TI39_contig1422g00001 [Zymoseptoria brevis]|uniref:Uncharacterized protein n=1 Tax=Zymoseptoria brevis TaxID=1047168 RepID=A0A0F4GFC8_9PEZI|nr:hypothetical protein TI39_contig1422g00001 [Zymoseptoria brevis]